MNVGGGALPSVRVEANPLRLGSMGLTLQSIQAMLTLQNTHQPTGQISDDLVTADIITNDQISHAKDYRPLIVGYRNGAAVRLSDVADVIDSTQNVRTAGYLNGKPAIVIIIYREPGANIIETVDRVRGAAAVAEGFDRPGHRHDDCAGSDDDDSRFGQRCGAHVDHLHRAGDRSGVRISAEARAPL